jgi:hypothetical protein
VVSPNDRPGETLARVSQWLDAGTTLVLVIDAPRRQAYAYREDGDVNLVSADARLDGGLVLPGFSCRLVDLLR